MLGSINRSAMNLWTTTQPGVTAMRQARTLRGEQVTACAAAGWRLCVVLLVTTRDGS